MRIHDLTHPDYDPADCPSWAKERLPEPIQRFRGRNGMSAAYREEEGALAMSVKGIDRYQGNQFIVYREETAGFLYHEYTPLEVNYSPGLLPSYEELAAKVVHGCKTDLEKALALLFKAMPRIKHPTIPPSGERVPTDRNLEDEALLLCGLGWCNEQARIFVRLCQVCGIPARIIQLFYADEKSGHCISEFYAEGRWCMADSSWLCVIPGPDGKLLSAAQCHDRGEGQRYCGIAYYKRQQELLQFSDAELNLENQKNPIPWRRRFSTETAEDLAKNMGFFGILNYPLPTRMNTNLEVDPATTSKLIQSDCEPLAIHGGPKSVPAPPEDLFKWPIITAEDEAAVLEVLRAGNMSGTDVTKKFEAEYAAWMGTKYALGFNNGTASLLAAMFAVGIGKGDEIICPATSYWAAALPVYSLGGTVVFADIDPQTLCLDPNDIEHRITPRTKAIVLLHYLGYPADMDAIMGIAKRHGLKVIEDVSHAQGGLYKGKKVGSFGDVACYSLMAGKSLVAGEGGMLTTNDVEIYERAIAFGHYERYTANLQTESLRPYAGLPLGGVKSRMHQLSAAVGRVQLKSYDHRCAEIRKAINYFWDQLESVPGVRAHRVDESTGSNMAGWYGCHGFYQSEELGGLSITRFCEALRAEGVRECVPGCNKPLHLHPLFNEADVYRAGAPTRIANSSRDLRQPPGCLPVSEAVGKRVYFIPWFKHYRPQVIDQYVQAFKKVATRADKLLADDPGDTQSIGGWNFFKSVS